MSDAWFAYWRPEQLQDVLRSGLLNHIGSNQLKRVPIGDRIWIVGSKQGRLYTIGYIVVANHLSRSEAGRRLRYKPWDARWHTIVPDADAITPLEVDLTAIAPRLRFVSTESTKLSIRDGRVDAQQLRTLRNLTSATASLVERTWRAISAEWTTKYNEALDAEFETDRRREVMTRLEQTLARRAVIGPLGTAFCALCNCEYSADLIVAAHIKRRSACSPSEKRDIANNIVPMCRLGCDELFERGYVVVDGGIVRATRRRTTPIVKAYIKSLVGGRCVRWNKQSAPYFRWHAKQARQQSRYQ